MDRRDYNDEERERFNNEGGGYIPRRRFNFSRSDYQNLDPSQLQGNVNSGDYSAPSYSQPYSQANYQPNPMPSQYPPQQPYPQQGYVVPQQPYSATAIRAVFPTYGKYGATYERFFAG